MIGDLVIDNRFNLRTPKVEQMHQTDRQDKIRSGLNKNDNKSESIGGITLKHAITVNNDDEKEIPLEIG